MKIPSGHQRLMPYLILPNASQFAPFCEQLFGYQQTLLSYREDGKTIMHAELKLADHTVMYAQATEQWTAQPAGLFIYVDRVDHHYQLALSLGSESIMEVSDQDYGRSCGVKDPFGNTWWMTQPNEV